MTPLTPETIAELRRLENERKGKSGRRLYNATVREELFVCALLHNATALLDAAEENVRLRAKLDKAVAELERLCGVLGTTEIEYEMGENTRRIVNEVKP